VLKCRGARGERRSKHGLDLQERSNCRYEVHRKIEARTRKVTTDESFSDVKSKPAQFARVANAEASEVLTNLPML
jgi:hypothetical protein